MSNCRICNKPLSFLETISGCRYEQFALKKEPFKLITRDVVLYRCNHCLHIQTDFNLEDDFYKEYSPLQGSSQYYGGLIKIDSKLKLLRGYCSILGNSSDLMFLDIGCGTGEALSAASVYFGVVKGVEPSQTADVAKKAGFDVVHDYFGDHLGMVNCVHAFSSCQVFEHLEEPLKILRSAYRALIPGGVGLINVPNGQMIATHRLYHQIVCEHINYFTPDSLCAMARAVGFELIEIHNNSDTFELDLYIKKPIMSKEYVSDNGLQVHKQTDQQTLHNILSKYQRVAVWGAGAKTIVYSQLLPDDVHVIHCFDSDSSKFKLYVSGIKAPIESPSENALSECDVVLIFASSYTEQIIIELKNAYHYSGAIVRFDKDTIVQYDI